MSTIPLNLALPVGLIGQALITLPYCFAGCAAGWWLGCLWASVFHLGIYALNRMRA